MWKDDYFVRIPHCTICIKLTTKPSSSVFDEIKHLCTSAPSSRGYAGFLFDSRNSDQGLINCGNLVRSLLAQLANRRGGIPAALKKLYNEHGEGREQPSLESLLLTLQLVVQDFDHVYLMIDALDECNDWPQLLESIEIMASWNLLRVHFLFTSRPEPDIKDRLCRINRVSSVKIGRSTTLNDITSYINQRVDSTTSWNDTVKKLVKDTLVTDADGMCVICLLLSTFLSKLLIGSD